MTRIIEVQGKDATHAHLSVGSYISSPTQQSGRLFRKIKRPRPQLRFRTSITTSGQNSPINDEPHEPGNYSSDCRHPGASWIRGLNVESAQKTRTKLRVHFCKNSSGLESTIFGGTKFGVLWVSTSKYFGHEDKEIACRLMVCCIKACNTVELVTKGRKNVR